MSRCFLGETAYPKSMELDGEMEGADRLGWGEEGKGGNVGGNPRTK